MAVFQMLHGPRTTLTAIALGSGFASSSDFSRAFRQTYGFSPRGFSRDRLLQKSKIRQDLLPNAGYGLGKLPDGRNPDRFRVRIVDRPAQRVAYERVIGSFDPQRLLAGKEDRAWKYLFHAWLPGSGYQPTDDPTMEVYRRNPPEIGWDTFDIDCCLPVRPLQRRRADD
jgi:AraC-like DNA-binding protein